VARTSGPAATILHIKRWLLVLLAAAIAGCGEVKIDSSKAEGLARKVAGLGNLKVTSASCPDGVTAKKGADFTCDLVFADGSKGTITIHQSNDDGAIRAAVSDIHRSTK
jgi:Domain of unknown function (DUF4333)